MSTVLLMTPQMMTAAEAAERLGVTARTIQRWADDGELEPLRRSPLMFSEAEVERKAAELADEHVVALRQLTGAEWVRAEAAAVNG